MASKKPSVLRLIERIPAFEHPYGSSRRGPWVWELWHPMLGKGPITRSHRLFATKSLALASARRWAKRYGIEIDESDP